MKRASSFVAALATTLLAVCSPAATVTTNILLCATSNDATAAAANQAASGWTFSSPGAETQAKDGSYYYPVKFNSGTTATSASVASGSYMTALVLGVKVSNVARTVTVTPYDASGTIGTPQTIAPSAAGSLVDVSFSFTASEAVSYVTVGIAGSGSATAYLYYATVTTETPSGGGGNTTPAATQASVGVNATVGTAVTLDLSDYFSDADGDTLTYAVDSGVGTVSGSTWTFTPNAAGSFSAVVSATDPSGASATMDISVVATLEGGLLIATLLDENFSNTATGWGSTSYFHSKVADAGTWTDLEGCTNMANARSAIVIGRASVDGCAISPVITLTNVTSGTVTIAFDTASFYGKTASGSLSIADAESGAVISVVTNFTPPAIAADSTAAANVASVAETGIRIVAKDVAVYSPFRLRFDSTRGTGSNYNRIYLDSILVTQVYDPDYAVLAAPTGVLESDVGKHGFTVSWTAVANASGYEVLLDGAVAGSCASTDTSTQLAGLSDGTTYSVQVRALGDGLHHGDSPLSTAISVTTEEDARNVVFTVTGAPAGDVYAGDPVSFTVAAQVEATGAAAPVNFTGIAGATFAGGTFSWTPAEADAGTNVATFASGAYSTNVAISVVSAFATTNLFRETFANCTTKWNASADMPVNGASSKETFVDEPGWTFAGCLRGMSGLKMGTEKVFGTATTRSIEPLSAAIPVQLSFRAAAYAGKTDCSLAVAVSDATGVVFQRVVDLTPMPDLTNAIPAGAAYEFGPYDVSVSGEFAISFERHAGDGRMGVDDILATQTVSAKIRPLAQPTGLALSGEAGETGFAFGWTAVSGATGYVVRVLDSAGTAAGSAAVDFSTATATVTNLADDASYTVQVRATGDPALWFDSPWSDALAVRTERSALHPTLSFGAWQNAVGDGLLHAGLANETTVSAALDDTTEVAFSYVGISPAPAVAPSFRYGTLSWRPSDDDTNKVFALSFEMTPVPGVTYATNVFCTVLTAPPLEPPVITVVSTGIKKASFSWDPEPQFRATGYLVRLWRGTTDYTKPGVCYESFFDRTMPLGWTGIGTGWYSNKNYDETPVQFGETGDTLITKLHSAPVTNLAFHIRSSSTTATSTWTLYASSGGTNETDWTSIRTTEPSTGGTFNVFPEEKNYRRFKWVFTKVSGTMGLGSIAAEHAGAGAKFVNGYGTAEAAQSVGTVRTLSVDTLRAGTEYFFEVTVTDGTGSASSVVRFATQPAPKATVLVFR